MNSVSVISHWRSCGGRLTAALLLWWLALPAGAAEETGDRLVDWELVGRLLSLRDYNTRVVLIGTMLLGLASGIIGSFMLLRKRSLMGDAISHATWPGICAAFLVMTLLGASGKFLPGLLLGAALTGLLGMLCVTLIRTYTRLKADAALGIVLSVFFGAGVSLSTIIQQIPTASSAGLQSFIYGKTASMLATDAYLIGGAALLVTIACALLFKEFAVLCFDQNFAKSRGYPVMLLDVLMMSLVVVVTVIGLQAVGLILIIALLIIPSAAARFWTDHLLRMVLVSAVIGAVSCLFGAAASAVLPDLPAGAIIVVVAAVVFLISLVVGPAHGMIPRLLIHLRLSRKIARQHLLRAIFECWEDQQEAHPEGAPAHAEASWQQLRQSRSWSSRELRHQLNWARRQRLVVQRQRGIWRLTDRGFAEATRLVHNHRLWEIYLITHAEVATSRVDRDADKIEHVLEPELVDQLEKRLVSQYPHLALPPSPHPLGGDA